MTEHQLPDKLSDLLQVGLNDLAKCEADERYHIDMNVWHSVQERLPPPEQCTTMMVEPVERCVVCMAGSVMGQSLGIPADISVMPQDMTVEVGPENAAKLAALDALRMGLVSSALGHLCSPRVPTIPQQAAADDLQDHLENDAWECYDSEGDLLDDPIVVCPYEESPKHFRQAMETLVHDLRSVGL